MKFVFFFISAKCIDSYTAKRVHKAENPDEDVTIDPRLEAIVDRMFKRCFDDGKYKQVYMHMMYMKRSTQALPSNYSSFIFLDMVTLVKFISQLLE